ncbi:hypothetical protein [Streptomyces sp. BK340]|uniref:hypothetical protein n=1 Tax=Streptomyces sp. BK340 TaxID=2572903 RepID=UPI0011A182E5|nr:hypothetical protein [Streptomyces sp. BK340]
MEARKTLHALLTSGYLTKVMWERSSDELVERRKSEWTNTGMWGLVLYAVTTLGVIARSCAALLGWQPWLLTPHWIVPAVGLLVVLGGLTGCLVIAGSEEEPGLRASYGVVTWVLVSVPVNTALGLSALLQASIVAAVVCLLVAIVGLCLRPTYRNQVTAGLTWDVLRFVEDLAAPYAPGQNPGVATSASSSTIVSNSLNPRR